MHAHNKHKIFLENGSYKLFMDTISDFETIGKTGNYLILHAQSGLKKKYIFHRW